ncbi:MAG TPA: phosphoribosylaminoimidazolesuccinocarboxamide synthase [Thermomicrobiales bacterium]|nr:phosphoribosylaminoimidazolesuccinocarboxamide synthase [Thermomicrobiales bacterium]
MTALRSIDIPRLRLYRRGKVRDMYDLGDRLLMVATDRVSAFDVVLPDAVPDKGQILTRMSLFWFEMTRSVVPNHLISAEIDDLPEFLGTNREALRDRFMLVRKAQRIDIECVVRGYLAGSGWAEYRRLSTVCGAPLPAGLVESEKLAEPIFTPAAKADAGHDENISIERMASLIGSETTTALRDTSIALYAKAEAYARSRGIIIADTKFEFGLIDDTLTVIDEMLTPDSSRFWDGAAYEPGRAQASFDKQPLRDWLEASGWNKMAPGPPLPPEIINETAERYRRAYERITGQELSRS